MTPDSSFGLGMTVAAALCWAGLDAARKVLVGRVSPVALLVLLTLGQLPLFAAWAVVEGDTIASGGYWLPGLVSMALNIAANLLFFRAVKLSDLSLTVPLLAFVPVFTVLCAIPLLGELPSVLQLGGIGVVVAGALLLNAGAAQGRGVGAFVQALLRERGSLPMLGTALCWSLTIVVDKLATQHAGYGIHGALLNLSIGVFGLGVLGARGELQTLGALRLAWKPWAFAIFAGALGLGLQLVAAQHLMVSLVEATKRAIGVTMSVVVGRWMFEEPITAPKVVSVLLMSIGAGMVVWT